VCAESWWGLNFGARALYSATGMEAWFMIHSPTPGMRWPFQVPAGME